MADQPGTLLQAMLAAGMPLNRAAGSLLMASGLQGHERSNGRDFLSNEQLIGGVKQGLNARDMGRTRWDPTTRRWMDGDQPYVSPGNTFNYGALPGYPGAAGAPGTKVLGDPVTRTRGGTGVITPPGTVPPPTSIPGAGGLPPPPPDPGRGAYPTNPPASGPQILGYNGFVPGFSGASGAPGNPLAKITGGEPDSPGFGLPGDIPTGTGTPITSGGEGGENPFSWTVWNPGQFTIPEFKQQYGGQPPPFANLGEQIKSAMGGFPMISNPAYPTFGMFGNKGTSIFNPFGPSSGSGAFTGNQFTPAMR